MSGRDHSWAPVLDCPTRPRNALRGWALLVLAVAGALEAVVLAAWDGPRWRGLVGVAVVAAGVAVADRMVANRPCRHEECGCAACLERFTLDWDDDPAEVLDRLWATLERRARRRGDLVVVGLTVAGDGSAVTPEWWAAAVVADLQARCGPYSPNGSCVLPATRQWAAGLDAGDVTVVATVDANTLEMARRLCRTLGGDKALASAAVSCS